MFSDLTLSIEISRTDYIQFIASSNVIGIVGYVLLLAVSSPEVKFFATFLCGMATYTSVGLNIAWLNVNVAPQYRRALAIGIQQTVGNCAGIVAGQIYRESPYVLGNSFSLGSLVVAQCVIAVHALYVRGKNREKEAIQNGEEDTRRVRTGDGDVEFRYHY